MEKRSNDTATIIGSMALLATSDPTGVSAAVVLILATAVVIKREF